MHVRVTASQIRAATYCALEAISALPPHHEKARLGRHLLKAYKMTGSWMDEGSMDASRSLDDEPTLPIEPHDIEVGLWNEALASGGEARIEETRNALLAATNQRIMDDDPNYEVAGWNLNADAVARRSVLRKVAIDVES